MENVSELEKFSIRKNWQQDSANDLSRDSLSQYAPQIDLPTSEKRTQIQEH